MKYFVVKNTRCNFILLIFLSLIKNFFSIAGIHLLSQSIQYLMNAFDQNMNIVNKSNINIFWIILSISFVSSVLGVLLSLLNTNLKEKYAQKLNNIYRDKFISNLYNQNYAYLKENNTTVAHNWINNDILLIHNKGTIVFIDLFDFVFTTIFSLVSLFILFYGIGLIVIFFTAICLILPMLVGNKLNKIGTEFAKNNHDYFTKLQKSIDGINNLFLLNRIDILIDKVSNDSDSFKKQTILYNKKYIKLIYFMSVIALISQVIAIIMVPVFSFIKYPNGSPLMYISSVFSVGPLVGNIFGAFQKLFEGITIISAAKATIRKNINQNDEQYEFNENININLIEFKNVSLDYDKKEILKNINLEFEKNKKYLIVGPSGSGKSSIIEMIMKMNNQYKGTILINDIDLKKINHKIINQNITYISNKNYLFDDSLNNNISIYDQNIDEQKINKSLQSANVDFISNDNFNKLINSNQFSTGQIQRLMLAQGFYKQNKYLILDESLANLDPKNAIEIEKKILLQNDLTFIHITHHINKDNQKLYDKIITIENKGVKYV